MTTLTKCKFCGATLPDVPTGARRREYCNDAHRQAYFRQQHKSAQPPTTSVPDLAAISGQIGTIAINAETLANRVTDLEDSVQTTVESLLKKIDTLEREGFQMRKLVLSLTQEIKALKTPAPPRLETSAQPQEVVPAPAIIDQPTYEDEWRVTINGATRYHHLNGSRARQWLDRWLKLHPQDAFQLIAPVFRPSMAAAHEVGGLDGIHKRLLLKSGEVINFLHDFKLDLLEYRCEASHRDVVASCVLAPYTKGTKGQYTLTHEDWNKVKTQGMIGEQQEKRARRLLATLVDRMRQEMAKCGWIEDGVTDASFYQPIWRKENE